MDVFDTSVHLLRKKRFKLGTKAIKNAYIQSLTIDGFPLRPSRLCKILQKSYVIRSLASLAKCQCSKATLLNKLFRHDISARLDNVCQESKQSTFVLHLQMLLKCPCGSAAPSTPTASGPATTSTSSATSSRIPLRSDLNGYST